MSEFDIKLIGYTILSVGCIVLGMVLARQYYQPIVITLKQTVSDRTQQYQELLQQTQQQNKVVDKLKTDSATRAAAAQLSIAAAHAAAQQEFNAAQILKAAAVPSSVSRCVAAEQLIWKNLSTPFTP